MNFQISTKYALSIPSKRGLGSLDSCYFMNIQKKEVRSG